MKDIKIDDIVHKKLLQIKAYYGKKTLTETIDMCIREFSCRNMPYENDKSKIK